MNQLKPKSTRGGAGRGQGRKANPDKLDTTISFRIKESWREPVKKVVRAEIKRLKHSPPPNSFYFKLI